MHTYMHTCIHTCTHTTTHIDLHDAYMQLACLDIRVYQHMCVLQWGWLFALAQYGDLPLHGAASSKAGVDVVAALLQAYPAGAKMPNQVSGGQRCMCCLLVCCIEDNFQHLSFSLPHTRQTDMYTRVVCFCECVCVLVCIHVCIMHA